MCRSREEKIRMKRGRNNKGEEGEEKMRRENKMGIYISTKRGVGD